MAKYYDTLWLRLSNAIDRSFLYLGAKPRNLPVEEDITLKTGAMILEAIN